MSIQNYLQERIGLNRLPVIGVSTNSRDIDEQVLVEDSRAFRDYLQANETESEETWSFCSYRGYQLLSDEGQNRTIFIHPDLKYEDPVVIKFPQSDYDSKYNQHEGWTYDAVVEGWDDPRWYAEVFDFHSEGDFLIQRRAETSSWLRELLGMKTGEGAKQRFEDIEKGWDFKDRNFGVIDGREVILDFPWHSEPWDGEDETAGKRLYTF